jgi:hypothetical protein
MTIAVVASTKISGANGGTTPSIDTTGADCIAIFLAYGGTPTVSDSKGNTYTADVTRTNAVTGRWYYCIAPTVGSGHTFTVGSSGLVATMLVVALSGVKQTSPFVTTGGTDINGVTESKFGVSLTPPENNCIVLMGTGMSTATISSAVAGSGWTLDQWESGVGSTYYGGSVSHKVQTTATAIPTTEVNASSAAAAPARYRLAASSPGQPRTSRPASMAAPMSLLQRLSHPVRIAAR